MKLLLRIIFYFGLLLAALYTAHFAVDLYIPAETTDEHRFLADQYLKKHNLPNPTYVFARDGCTLWPDKLFGHDFYEPCLHHDIAYWAGGSKELQKETNLVFKESLKSIGPLGPLFSIVMYSGVVYFGDNGVSRVIRSHWGYGWN